MLFAVLLLMGAGISADSRSKLVSEAQVDAWIKSWQHRLQMDEWRIETRLVRTAELKPGTIGNLKWNVATHTASIKVLSPIDYQLAPAEIPLDIEYTVVHELVHLQLAVLPRDMSKPDVEEAVVNKFADALMSLDKGDSFRARSVSAPKTAKDPGEAPKDPEVARKTGS